MYILSYLYYGRYYEETFATAVTASKRYDELYELDGVTNLNIWRAN